MKPTFKNLTIPTLIFLLALTLRFGYAHFLKENYFFHSSHGEDVMYYKNWAKAIAYGSPQSPEPFAGMPLFAYYLAVLFRLTLGNWEAVAAWNLILGSLNCVLVFLLANKLFSRPVAVTAGVVAALNFMLIYYDWLMMPITLLITFTLAILIALCSSERLLPRQWFWAGVLLGTATLGDGKFLIFSVFLIAYLIFQKRDIAKFILPLILGLVLVLGGVTLRNRIVGGEWIFITSQSGLSFLVGNNPSATGAYEHPSEFRPSHEGQDADQRIVIEQALGRPVSAGETSRIYLAQGIDFIKNKPLEYLSLLGQKTVLFLSDHEYTQAIDLILQRDYKLRFDTNSWTLILPLALIGIFIRRQSVREHPHAVLLVVSQLIFCLIYFVSTRHRVSILPVLLIYQAAAFVWISENLMSRKWRPALIAALIVILFAVTFRPRFLDAKTYAFLRASKTGSVYDSQQNYAKAAEAYRKALELQPQDINNTYNLATAYVNLNEFALAKSLYYEAIAMNPHNVDVWFNLGYVFEKTGENTEALKAYRQVLHLTPDTLDAHYRIAMIHLRQGECEMARQHFDTILKQKPFLRSEIEPIASSCQEDIPISLKEHNAFSPKR